MHDKEGISIYLLFAGYYEDENYYDDSYVADQQFPMSWANLINVESIIVKENMFIQLHVHNIRISEHQNDLLSFKTYLARLYIICDIVYGCVYGIQTFGFETFYTPVFHFLDPYD